MLCYVMMHVTGVRSDGDEKKNRKTEVTRMNGVMR